MRHSAFAFAVTLLLSAGPATAQLLTNPVQEYINRTTLLNNILSNARAIDMSQKAQTGGKSSTGIPAAPNSTPAVDPTRFTPTGAPVLPKMLSEKVGSSPVERQQAEQLFASLVQLYEQTAKNDRFPSNDLAYAFEYFVVNSYHTAHDLHDVDYDKDPRIKRGKDMFERITIASQKKLLKVTREQEVAIYTQLKNRLTEDQAVRAMTDRQKQELAELLAIVFGLNYRMYMKGVSTEDDRLMDQARQTARTYLEKLTGAPIDRIKIANNGLQF